MKKSLIVTGAASLALAAMPVVGVFAEGESPATTTRNSVTDVLNVKVPDSCTLSATPNAVKDNDNNNNYTMSPSGPNNINDSQLKNYVVTYFSTTADALSNGQSKEYTATTINVICNDDNGWMVNALGTSDTGTGKTAAIATDMAPATNNSTPIHSITGTTVPSGDDTSWWAMKLTVPTDVTYQAVVDNSYGQWHGIPATAQKVVHGPMTDTTVAQTATTGVSVGDISGTGSDFTTNYKVSIGTAQQADTYTGKVTYTLVHPNVGNGS